MNVYSFTLHITLMKYDLRDRDLRDSTLRSFFVDFFRHLKNLF